MLTLVHEDICVYLDYMISQSLKKTGKNLSFTNDSIEGIANLGKFEIEVVQGSFYWFTISIDSQVIRFDNPLSVGDKLSIDLDKNIFKKNGSMIFTENILTLEDNSYVNVNLDFIGEGIASATYFYKYYEKRTDDLMFVDSLSYDKSIEYSSRTNIQNKKKIVGNKKETFSFSLSLIWNEDQAELIDDEFRLRLVDEEGYPIETMAGCVITSERKGSSSNGGDFTYEISGSFEKIY
ncbi:hypothetical protein Slash_47 [Bacillus phage Slash]|uniref:Uncharacterized protein n=1 Tax=Bacillus phage Slash TaxID=1406790 RepID=U5PX21_9CAUD|nr:hypothetical protein Slash_47 [Bacillus phage Slash]AGY48336.1 hypothetical protein Slash_47 [Bacillus phage Slash]